MLEPTIHHLLDTLPYLAEVTQLPLIGVQAVAAALAVVAAVLLTLVARGLAR